MIFSFKILEFFKNYWKPLSYVILIIAIVILFMLLQSETIRANEAEEGRDAAIKISNESTAIIHKYRNKQGDSVTTAKAVVIPKTQMDELLKQNDLKWLKKFEGLKSNGSNLQSGEAFTITFEAEKIPEKPILIPCPNDSIKAFEYNLHDKWNDIHAMVIDTPKIEIRDRIYSVIEMHRPKHWFWKLQWSKWEPISEITNSNKLIKIDSVAVIIVK